jgi:hypothetical protein
MNGPNGQPWNHDFRKQNRIAFAIKRDAASPEEKDAIKQAFKEAERAAVAEFLATPNGKSLQAALDRASQTTDCVTSTPEFATFQKVKKSVERKAL